MENPVPARIPVLEAPIATTPDPPDPCPHPRVGEGVNAGVALLPPAVAIEESVGVLLGEYPLDRVVVVGEWVVKEGVVEGLAPTVKVGYGGLVEEEHRVA